MSALARRLTLAEARGIIADVAHHSEAEVIAACQAVIDHDPNTEDADEALALWLIYEGDF